MSDLYYILRDPLLDACWAHVRVTLGKKSATYGHGQLGEELRVRVVGEPKDSLGGEPRGYHYPSMIYKLDSGHMSG